MLGQFTNHVFERHPPSWISEDNDMENLARTNIGLHFLLFIALILGLILSLLKKVNRLGWPQIFHSISLFIFLLFVINYVIKFRDFSFMKVVFIYPAYVSMIALSARGISYWNSPKIFSFILLICTLLYQVNFMYLVEALIQ